MKRYLLFAGADYEASGGWRDFVGSFDSVEEADVALAAMKNWARDWWHIIDTTDREGPVFVKES